MDTEKMNIKEKIAHDIRSAVDRLNSLINAASDMKLKVDIFQKYNLENDGMVGGKKNPLNNLVTVEISEIKKY